MRRTSIPFIVFLLSCAWLSGQNNQNELSLNVSRFASQFLSFNDNLAANGPYLFAFKSIDTSTNKGFRCALGLDLTTRKIVDDPDDKTTLSSVNFDFRVGYEKRFAIGKKWQWFTGIDFISGISTSKNKVDSGFEQVTIKETSWEVGTGPILGVIFNINDRLSLWTESSFYLQYGETRDRTEFSSSPGTPGNIPETKISSFNWNLLAPTQIYFGFKI